MDFKDQLRKQLRFLENSCLSYDQGDLDEAIRIAVSVRVLVHDTYKCTSILAHLNAQHIDLLSTATLNQNGKPSPGTLTSTRIKLLPPASMDHIPFLEKAQRKEIVSFDVWWRREPIYGLSSGLMFRRDLILGAANKDGGAHVDKRYDPAYEELTEGHGLELTANPVGAPAFSLKTMNGHLAAIRQIGFEITNSPAICQLASN